MSNIAPITVLISDVSPVSFSIPNVSPVSFDFGNIFIGGDPVLEELVATPTSETQVFVPQSGVDGFSQVTVNPIPSNYGLITYNGFELTVS